MNPGTGVNKSFFSTIGNANTPQNQEIADKKRMENVENKPTKFVNIDPNNLSERNLTATEVKTIMSSNVGNKMMTTSGETGQNIYDADEDVVGSKVGSQRNSDVSTSSRLFNYLTSTPGFLMLTANNFQFFVDAGVTLYSPTRIYNPDGNGDGKICINELGIIASMQIADKDKIPTVENFIKYTTLSKNYNDGTKTDIINPNFLFFVKDSDVTDEKLKEVNERKKKEPLLKTYLELNDKENTKRKTETEQNIQLADDAEKRNNIVKAILQRKYLLLNIDEYLKNDRYFSLLNSLTGFDIYEQNTLSSEKTYKGILKSVSVSCATEQPIHFLSKNFKVELNVETWVKGTMGPNFYKIEEQKITVGTGKDYPQYFANVLGKNYNLKGADNLKDADGKSFSQEEAIKNMNEVGSKNVGRYSLLDKKTLGVLINLYTSNNIKIDDGVAKMIGERANSIKKFDEFIKTVNNPFVYKFRQTDIVHNDNLGFLQGKNCYEIRKESFVKWLGKFDSVTTDGKATFTKNYQNSICNPTYQFNFGNDGPVVLALRPITSAKWFMDLSNLTDELSSAFQQIFGENLSRVLDRTTLTIDLFYANEKSKMAIAKLKGEFNEKLNNICGANGVDALKDTIAKINEVLSSSNDLQEWENAINGVFVEGELECIINFVDLHTSTTHNVNIITKSFQKLLENAGKIQKLIDDSSVSNEFNQETIKEYNEIKRRFDERALSGLKKQAKSLSQRVDKTNASTAISEEHKNDEGEAVPLKVSSKPDLNAPGAKYKVNDYVFITKMPNGTKRPQFSQKYARVISSKVLKNDKGDDVIIYILNVFTDKNDYDDNLRGAPVSQDKIGKVMMNHIVPATQDDIVKSFGNVALAQNEQGGGGAKHTRRSHATGLRKNVTRHGNHGLIRRRTSHKGRKRGAHAKTAKK